MSEGPTQSTTEIRDAIRHLLPHGSFDLTVVRAPNIPNVNAVVGLKNALVIRCRCGRRLDWPTGDTLPMDILLWWLIDHDDEMFLTPRELEAKYAARMAQSPVTLDPFGRPLVYDPLGALGLPSMKEQP